MEACAAGFEDIFGADIDGIVLRGIDRHLFILHNRREKSHHADAIRPQVGDIHRHACSVAEACGISGRDTVRRIDHVDKVAQRIFNPVLASQAAVVQHTFPFVGPVNRSRPEGPLIAIRHNKNHRLTTARSNQCFERVNRRSFILPRPFIAVDAVQEIKDGIGGIDE